MDIAQNFEVKSVFRGCHTASITPMLENRAVDIEGLRKLVEFQVEAETAGILAVGTTGESPTLTGDEHNLIIAKVHEFDGERCITIAGTGSNSTEECISGTRHAAETGVEAVLLVDPYYNGPSSLEIRKEYIEPIAREFHEIQIIPYVIPGRTGTQLLPQDLAILHSQFGNVRAVKEATGNIKNMRLIRKLCGESFDILSGDDNKTFDTMLDKLVKACGVISVASNVAPKAVQEMSSKILDGRIKEGKRIGEALKPLFQIVTVKTMEETSYGPVECRARNPLPYKTLMNILGMPSGPCRRPLGKMTKKGIKVALSAIRKVHEKNPEITKPLEDFFDVDLDERLYKKKYWKKLTYD